MCQTDFFASAVVTVGFNTVNHAVLEDAGSVNVTISILNGTLARNVVVTLLTLSSGRTTGEFIILHPGEIPMQINLSFLLLQP